MNNIVDDDITITKAEYDRLLEDARLYLCLRDAGVDNWEGWDHAVETYNNGANK